MAPDPQSAARVKHLVTLTMLAIVLTSCSLPAGRDVRAYNACVARHPDETALCEGPRQAYEVDAVTLQATAAAIAPSTW
jgi:hypothetical protein